MTQNQFTIISFFSYILLKVEKTESSFAFIV
jgi:hypothetical protein